jgi:hypothetical protein
MKIFTSCTDSSSPLVERPKPTGLRDHRRKNFERAQTVLHHMVERPKPTRSRNHGKKTLKRLAEGPSSLVTSWQAYDINGYTLYTMAFNSVGKTTILGARARALLTQH